MFQYPFLLSPNVSYNISTIIHVLKLSLNHRHVSLHCILIIHSVQNHPQASLSLPDYHVWIPARVSRCYGCGQSLKPGGLVPQASDDLVVTTRPHRKYFKDGRQHISSDVSSVYYHVNLNCVNTAFPGFQSNHCQVPSDLLPFLPPEYKEMAANRLGLLF